MELLYRTFTRVGGDRLVWRLDPGRLRILCYHGVCDDHLADEPWMPHFFVTQSVFEKQLQYLSRFGNVLPLSEAVERLRAGSLPPRSVSITFDDGYANNLESAYPLLRKYGIPATIFLSTWYMESGEYFPFLKLKLVRAAAAAAGVELAAYKSNPVDEVLRSADPWWPQVRASLSEDQHRTLRPMTISEIRSSDATLLEFGGHTHRHCILRNEAGDRRASEIRDSITRIREWTGRPGRLFSYPNGERGDFAECDKAVLRQEGIQAAVTGIPGANDRHADTLALRRYPIGLFHREDGFRAEVTGFRSTVRFVSRSWSR